MRIWHHVLRPESLTYTIAKALSYAGHEVVVSAARLGFNGKPPGEIERRVHEIPGVTVVASEKADIPAVIDRLIVQVHPRPAETLEAVGALAQRARRITLISGGDRSRTVQEARKVQWLELRRLHLHLRKVDRVLYKDGYRPNDLLRWLPSRAVVGFDAHSQYLHEPELFQAIHARDWDPAPPRTILANFIGSRDPKVRTNILDGMRAMFRPGSVDYLPPPPGKSLLWREYSDDVPDALAPADFVRTLTNCDFTLCPRGYSMVTHRPIEGMLRGSVPVLDVGELDLYGIPLQDGRNCVAVQNGNWAGAIKRLVNMSECDIIGMRRHIWSDFQHHLSYDQIASSIRSRLGVD